MRASFLLGLMLILVSVDVFAVAAPERYIVIVVSEKSTLTPLNLHDLRQLFMGRISEVNGVPVHPLRNMSDERLYQVFLQKIVFMSARNYEQYLLSRVFRMGGFRPPVYPQTEALVEALLNDPNRISYMWNDQLKTFSGLKVLQDLWLKNPR